MKIAKIGHMDFFAQDGAIFGDLLFRFDNRGRCKVFDASPLKESEAGELPFITEFHTSPADAAVPHFNAVCFGAEYYEPGDEFPLLYANLYNNYGNDEDRQEGVCLVYRLTRTDASFKMTLVQAIVIGFTRDPIWISEGIEDVRPYGNFVVDAEGGLYHAFTMRDKDKTARYFTFRLPRLNEGTVSEKYRVPTVTLEKEDIISYFDTDYHHYIQGACVHGGLIYSTEGFNATIRPAIRVIDPKAQRQLYHLDLVEHGETDEAEWIDFMGERCIYSNAHGMIFDIKFD